MCWCGCLKGMPKVMRLFLPCAIGLLILWLYTCFVFNPRGLARVPLLHALLYQLCVLLLGASLGRTMTASVFARESPLLQRLDGAVGVVELKYNGEKRFCRKCDLPKPDRTHHCSSCNACIAKMDHHCVFLNKCIGLENYKFFVLFLFWSAVSCLVEASLLYAHAVPSAMDELSSDFLLGQLALTSAHCQIVLVCFASVCVGLALTCFLAMHLYLAASNMTTLEYCEKRDEVGYVNYYYVGVLGNLRQVFGPLPLALFPLHPPHMASLRLGFPSTKLRKTD
ncbi:hypothetical protein SPRG_00663 [Saprolegnia parasitica CBS 223.65]|uniref:Palmitoyltransferase n=1 Tax=Saprolegnia parasitica (strain CBS 223.65) TaxID=695850 RepID=A0A067CZB4_SAPPC|nr:hypothetical protein SPRG_00663 [Saprolegnia parasitica CBS 223.65]KDO34600.1 hypothetical protein SPRG_00663 [Saprolegnia parasitica CBS 223.65]|eukprot:XP_012194277.1 hypothetical protein SPRG_00663 [Saprolegnia parasitica CBS 223.65]